MNPAGIQRWAALSGSVLLLALALIAAGVLVGYARQLDAGFDPALAAASREAAVWISRS